MKDDGWMGLLLFNWTNLLFQQFVASFIILFYLFDSNGLTSVNGFCPVFFRRKKNILTIKSIISYLKFVLT